MAVTGIHNDQTARYFDLCHYPDTLKRKDEQPIDATELREFSENRTTVPEDWDVEFGDVINWSDDLPTEAYFVLQDRTLLKNPDRGGSGCLTIPFIVTKHSRNALTAYQYVIDCIGVNNVDAVELHPEDTFITRYWGEIPQKMLSYNVQFSYNPLEEYLYVDLPHLSRSKGFKLGQTTAQDILAWFSRAVEEETSFRIKYNFSGSDFHKYRYEYKLHNLDFPLPQTWSVEPGTTDIGHDHCHGEWIFRGDRQHLHEVQRRIRNFYKDLPVSIEDTP